MGNTSNFDGSNGGPAETSQKDTTEGIAEGVAKTVFKRFDRENAMIGSFLLSIEGEVHSFHKELL